MTWRDCDLRPGQPPVPPPAGHESLRLTRVLEPGFVVTMEPGIYFIDMLLERARSGRHGQAIDWPGLNALRPYGGIRIEDNLCVNCPGHQNLTREAFRVPARGRPSVLRR